MLTLLFLCRSCSLSGFDELFGWRRNKFPAGFSQQGSRPRGRSLHWFGWSGVAVVRSHWSILNWSILKLPQKVWHHRNYPVQYLSDLMIQFFKFSPIPWTCYANFETKFGQTPGYLNEMSSILKLVYLDYFPPNHPQGMNFLHFHYFHLNFWSLGDFNLLYLTLNWTFSRATRPWYIYWIY